MKALKIVLQAAGVLALAPAAAMAALYFKHRGDDGPSILFPGGELVSGELHAGPEPDWDFTAGVRTVELQLDASGVSRLIWILNADGRGYVVSGYMSTALGRLWKHWAVEADEGDGLATLRIDGIRYPRRLVRIRSGGELDGVAASLLEKYMNAPAAPQAVAGVRASMESGSTWVFALAPREGR